MTRFPILSVWGVNHNRSSAPPHFRSDHKLVHLYSLKVVKVVNGNEHFFVTDFVCVRANYWQSGSKKDVLARRI